MNEIQIQRNALDMHSVCQETDIRPYGRSSSFLKPSGRFLYVCVCVLLDSSADEAVLVSIFIAVINVNKCRGLNEFRLA